MSHPEQIPGIVERLRTTRLLSQRNQLSLQNEAADHIERLTAENERLQLDGIHTCHDECQRPACVLRRQNAMLAEALRPFAEAAEDLDESTPDRCSMWEHHVSINVEAGDFRRARATLSLIKEGGHGNG